MDVSNSSGLSYSCPNCGAPITYSPESKNYSCDYCLSTFSVEEMEAFDQRRENKKRRQQEKANPETQAEEKIHIYNCQNCGAQVMTTDTTTATFCYYCHSPVIIESRLLGEDRPDEIIPFSIDRDKAEEIFLKWTEDKKYLPDDFRSTASLEKLTGIYIPYWYLDSEVSIDFEGQSVETRLVPVGDYLYHYVTAYTHVRDGEFLLTDLNTTASSKIDINLLNGIEPFPAEKIQSFSMPLLSGFFAEKYDISKEDSIVGLNEQIEKISDDLLNESLRFASAIKTLKKDIESENKTINYALMPVWVLTYKYQEKIYVFAVNGDTGKATGELPLVKAKLMRDVWLMGAIIFIAVFIFILFIQGVL